MSWVWFAGGVGFALLNSFSLWKKNRKLEGIAKPATLVLLILGVGTAGLEAGSFPTRLIFFIVGLVFCLIGDVFLYLPPEKFFRMGLGTFLLGHIGYIFGFGWVPATVDQHAQIVLFLIFVLVFGVLITKKLIQSLRNSGRENLVLPIAVYALVISAMLFFATIRFFDTSWSTSSSYLVALGALSFYSSDVLNAWQRFVTEFPNDRLIIVGLYHLGQFAIGIGVVLHFFGNF